MYVLLIVLLVDVSVVFSLKTSKKHESMISKSTKQTETKSSEATEPEPVAKTEESHVSKKSTPDAVTVAASASAAKPATMENKDNAQVVDETAIGLLETDPIEKDEDAIVADETALMGTTPGFLISKYQAHA